MSAMPVFCLCFSARRTILQMVVLQSHVVPACVRPSVTFVDQDHIGYKSWKLIARTIRPNYDDIGHRQLQRVTIGLRLARMRNAL